MRGPEVRGLGSMVMACLALSLAAAVTGLRASTETATGLLHGRVTWAATGSPLEQVPLRLLGFGVQLTARSGDAGRFRFERVPAGTYLLTADLPALAAAIPVDVTVVPGSETRADLIVILPEAPAERITVVGARRAGGHEGVSTEIYDAATLRSRPGALDDPFRALAGAAGVRAENDFKADVGIRGGTGADTRVLLDGLPVFEPFHFAGGAGSASAVSGDLVESVEVHSGGFSVEHGDTLAGVVEIHTPRLRPESVAGRAGFGTTLGHMAVTGPLAASGRFRVTGRAGDLGLYDELLQEEEVESVSFRDLYGAFEFALPGGGRLETSILRGSSDFGQRVGTSGRAEQNASHGATNLRLEIPLDSRTLLRAFVSAGKNEGSARVTGGPSFDGAMESTDARASIVRLHGSGHTMTAGMNLSVTRASLLGLVAEGGGLRASAIDEEGRTSGVFVEDRWERSSRFGIRYGARLDRYSLTGESEISPRISVILRPAAGLKITGAVGRFVQFARPRQRFLASAASLAAQKADELIVGVERRWGSGHRLVVEAFHRDIRDPVVETVNRYVDLPEALGQFDTANVRGLEVTWERVPRGPWRYRIDYALMEAQQEIGGMTTPMNTDQRHSLNALIGRRLGRGWDLTATARYGSGLPYTPVLLGSNGINLWLESGPLNSARLPGYHRLDLRLAHQRPTAWGRVLVHFDLINVYDQDNLRSIDVDLDPAARTLTRTRHNQVPFMPVFGVSAEF